MGRQFFRRGLAGTAGDRDHGMVPFEIDAMGEPLQSRNRIIDKNQTPSKRFKPGPMLFKPVLADNACGRSIFKSRRYKTRRIFKIAIETVISILGLRESEEQTALDNLARVDSK